MCAGAQEDLERSGGWSRLHSPSVVAVVKGYGEGDESRQRTGFTGGFTAVVWRGVMRNGLHLDG